MSIMPADQFAKYTIKTAVEEGYISGGQYRSEHPDLFHDLPVYMWWGCNCGGGGDGDPRGVLVIAAILAAFASIVCTIKSFISGTQAVIFNKQKALAAKKIKEINLQNVEDPDKVIYKKGEFIWKNMAQERTASSISQFVMALGLMALSAACVIAILNYKGSMHDANLSSKLALYGVIGFGSGLTGYLLTQLVNKLREEEMQKAANMIKDRFVAMKAI